MIAKTPTSRSKAIVLYDGQCPFCLKSVSILKRLDWFHTLEYQNARETNQLPSCEVPLEPNRLLEEMHLITPNRKRVYSGFEAFRWIAMRIPLLWSLVPWMYLPGIPKLGQKAYLWVAKNRFKLVPCHDGVCHLPGQAKKK
jgi:predicted DCC family thiol-disulfide oxidoreductase YuxK